MFSTAEGNSSIRRRQERNKQGKCLGAKMGLLEEEAKSYLSRIEQHVLDGLRCWSEDWPRQERS